MKRLLSNFVVFLGLILTLSACTATEQTRGNFAFEEDIAAIQAGQSTQSDVLRLLGTPTAKAVFDDKTWYYVGLKTEKESFFDEKVTDRQTIKITFNDENIVDQIENLQSDALDVPINDRVTPTSGNEVTAIQQILGNIGKFNPQTQ